MMLNNQPSSPIQHFINRFKTDANIQENISAWEISHKRSGIYDHLPEDLSPELIEGLQSIGIDKLYAHQAHAYYELNQGHHVVIATGTASGKTLCYQLPILDRIIKIPETTALFVFPTKALAYDQYDQIQKLAPVELRDRIAVYDGDTPQHLRGQIRKSAQIILTNPDMLHSGILPHHTIWQRFLTNLSFVVIDEIHVYRGIFGSHLANVIRRLKRIAEFYRAAPQFSLTSATISNPLEHAENLIEAPAVIIDQNGAPQGDRHFLLYNPPWLNQELGIRRGALSEASWITGQCIEDNIQTLMFAQTRRAVEIGVRHLQDQHHQYAGAIFGYRSGYLAADRRKIELALKNGSARAVVSTNALELGIDIGSMDAVVIVGYPGTIAATRQQAGRAGRKLLPSLSIFVASARPLDQFLVRHPDYLLERPTEKALINPNNPVILLQHLRCALFELSFAENDNFGALEWPKIAPFFDLFAQLREAHFSNGKYFWTADQYVSQGVSLRTTTPEVILLQTEFLGKYSTIGEVDAASATWMVHPQAVYLHQGQSYLVESLNFEQGSAILQPFHGDYYTETISQVDIEKLSETQTSIESHASHHLGEVKVTTQVVGFRKIRWTTNEHLAAEPLEMPASELRTVGYWLTIAPDIVRQLEDLNLWTGAPINYGPNWETQNKLARARDRYTCQNCGAHGPNVQLHVHHKIPFRQWPSYEQANRLDNLVTLCPVCHKKAEGMVKMRSGLAGLGYSLSQLAPLFIMCDTNDLGSHVDAQSPLSDGQPSVVIYDQVPAGIGLCDELYKIHDQLIQSALDLVTGCDCQDGCPACVGAAGEMGSGGKSETIALLQLLNGKPVLL